MMPFMRLARLVGSLSLSALLVGALCCSPSAEDAGTGGRGGAGANTGGSGGATSGGGAGTGGTAGAGGGGGSGGTSQTGGAAGAGATGGTGGASGAAGTGGSGGVGTGGAGGGGTGGAAGAGGGGSAGSAGRDGGGSDAAGGSAGGGGARDSGAPSEGGSSADPGKEGDGQIDIASPFKASAAQTVGAGVTKGQRVTFTMDTSPTYSGSHRGTVYLPAGYTSGTEVPFMVVLDGIGYVNNVANALDNLIHDKKVPAMAVVFIDPGSARSQEYDTVSDKFAKFAEAEVIPAAKAAAKSSAQVELNLTSDPEGRGTMGGSSGGSCAFTMGWFHPELYRRIVTYSGSFTKLAPSTMYPNGAADYYKTLIPATAMKPLRVFLASGTKDLDNQFGVWLDANDGMFKELTAKGYHTRYIRATGAQHVDGGVLTQTLADTLTWVWRGYPIK